MAKITSRHSWKRIFVKAKETDTPVLSHEVCRNCGTKRKRRWMKSPAFQTTDGKITYGKTPPCEYEVPDDQLSLFAEDEQGEN